VGGSLERFSGRVGTDGRQAIANHLQSIRDTEKNLDAISANQCGAKSVAVDLTSSAQYPLILDAHMGLLTAALACGVTRVGTLQLSDALGMNIDFGSFVEGLPPRSSSNYKSPYRNWADLANNPVQGGVDHKQLVDEWYMARLAAWITKLKLVPDAAGTSLFDNLTILWTNTVEDGANKNTRAVPFLLAGRCGNRLHTGQSAATAGTPTSGVLASVCAAMGVSSVFGTPTPGVLA
jgi:hypothetical protein